jgi:hypothetical protein
MLNRKAGEAGNPLGMVASGNSSFRHRWCICLASPPPHHPLLLHLHHIRVFPSRRNSIGIEIGDESDERSSKWRFEDEGSDSPGIYAQWMAEGVGGQAVTSHTP